MKTHKDFKIGQSVMCVGDINDPDFNFYSDNGHLTPGKYYTITDIDFHFPDSIAVETDGGYGNKMDMFCKIKFFDNISELRDKKLEEILKK